MTQLFVGFSGLGFMSTVMGNVKAISSDWATLEPDLSKRSEYPSHELTVAGADYSFVFDPKSEDSEPTILLAPGTR